MPRPNILILYTDQQRWDALGAAGNPEIHTPNLDRLAGQGVHYTHCGVQNAVCMPSRISFLSGQYPSTLGITHMGVPVPEDTITLPVLLHAAGYRTANIGKLHFLPHSMRDHRDPHPSYGFDHLQISDEPGCYEDAYHAWVRARNPKQIDRISVGLPPARDVFDRQYLRRADRIVHPPREPEFTRVRAHACDDDLTHTAFVSDQTRAFLQGVGQQPFLCIAGFYSPHSPWIAPQKWLDHYQDVPITLPPSAPLLSDQRGCEREAELDGELLRQIRRGYYAMVSEVDQHCGLILDTLDQLGMSDNTIVVFTSDHGEYLGQLGKWGKGPPGHDMVMRVPLICRWPAGIARPGATSDQLVEALDVMPTLLEAAGVPVPASVQGRSLLPEWQDNNSLIPNRDSILLEWDSGRTLRTTSHRYTIDATGHELLFDLTQPAGDLVNVLASADGPARYHDVLNHHRHAMLQRIIAAHQPRPRLAPY